MGKDEKEEPLSAEELEVNAIFYDAAIRLREIDDQLNALLPDKGMELTPPGSPVNRPFGTKKLEQYRLNEAMSKITTEAKEKANSVLQRCPPQLSAKVAKKIERWRNPDYKEKFEEKDISQTQESLLREKKENLLKMRQVKSAPDFEEVSRSEAQPGATSMSMRFSQSLGYTDIGGTSGNSGKLPGIDKE